MNLITHQTGYNTTEHLKFLGHLKAAVNNSKKCDARVLEKINYSIKYYEKK